MDPTSIKTTAAQTGVRPGAAPAVTPPLPLPRQGARPARGLLATVLTPLASLRLTVVLFVLSLVLVFAGTLAQIDNSNWAVVATYFRAFFVWVPFQIFFPRSIHVPGGFPFVGGYVIGTALMVNLLAAHAVRFKLTWKRSGILLLHAGLIVMLLGELVTGLFAVEAMMTIPEGGAVNYVERRDTAELAFTVPAKDDPRSEDVVVVPGSRLSKGGVISDPRLPVDIVVNKWMRNSDISNTVPPSAENLATVGDGLKTFAVEASETSGTDANQRINIPSAYVTFKDKKTGESLGTYLTSVYQSAFGDAPQHFTVGDTTYDVALRFKRIYKPYTIRLHKFSHDLYDGTDIPKNYSSLVQLEDPARGANREVLIWMNHPLRYDGDTLYQADFLKGAQRGTILQVVRNPGWTMPYVSCTMVALGLLIHFGITLVNFLTVKVPALANHPAARPLNGRAKAAAPPAPTDWSTVGVCSFAVGVSVLYLLVAMAPPASAAGQFDYNAAGKIVVTDGGRQKPLDSFARSKLLFITSKQSLVDDDKVEHPAMEWLFDVMTSRLSKNGKAENYKVFRIENDEVLNFLGLPERPGSYRYSINEIFASDKIGELQEAVQRIRGMDEKGRKLFDIKLLELADRLEVYLGLTTLQTPLMVDPPSPGEKPESLRGALARAAQTGEDNPQAEALGKIFFAYTKGDVGGFNSAVADYNAKQAAKHPEQASKADFETFFNHFAPFYQCMILYVVVLVLAALSWLTFHKPLNRAAFWLTVTVFIVHTFALISRMYIQERPFVFVTNLYSSAVFIGWVAVLVLLVIERFFRYSIATFLAGVIGFATLFIAHLLSLDGDTLEMMRAVLDTNFWLATHVTAVTIGYAATFVAGFLGLLYIGASIYNTFTGKLDRDLFSTIAGYMLYGVVCFAMFFSFTGTVLGGIWADQSWGRFWGWDAKENGALLIVIWNALILHARWAGLVKARGMAGLAVIGNVITAWSWFGVNMLGVGLHSYGFMQGAVSVLLVFVVSQLAALVCCMIPALHRWQTVTARDRIRVGDV